MDENFSRSAHVVNIIFLLRTEKETFLANLSRDNVQLLINQIFQLPTIKVDNEVVIKLPAATTRLPRAKPAPKEKQLTKWEKYAKEKGITKRKKSKATWDEELQVGHKLSVFTQCHCIHLFFSCRNGFPDLVSKKLLLRKRKIGLLKYQGMLRMVVIQLLCIKPKSKNQLPRMSCKD